MANLGSIGAPNGKAILEHANGLNSDIIKTLNKNVPEAVNQCKPIAESFRGADDLETCQNIFDFLKTKIKYVKDPASAQMVRLPKRFVRDKKGDCKSFSLFTAGVLGALGIPFKIRYAGYNGLKIPTHVYVVTDSGIIIDAVYKYFNKQKQPTYIKDMKVYTLSGLDNVSYKAVNGLFKKKSKAEKAKKKEERKGKKKGKVNKIVLAPARAAFLGLIKINAHGLATKLSQGLKKDSSKLEATWKKLGGDFSQFKKQVEAGAKKKSIFGIGSVAVAAAAVATAAPVIVIVVKELKKLGLGGEDLNAINSDAEAGLQDQGTNPEDLERQVNAGADTGSGFSFTPTTGLLVAGAAAVVIFGGKKLFK